MIYNKSLQGRFVSGLYTPVVLLVVALALWGCNTFVHSSVGSGEIPYYGAFSGTFLSSLLSLLLYLASFFVLRSIDLFERRLRFMPALFVLFAVALPLSDNSVCLFSLLLVMLSAALLFHSQQSKFVERTLFSAFAFLGCTSLLFPQALLLFVPFLAFLFYSNVFSVKRLLSALLGAITPFWFAFGIAYIFPTAGVLLEPFCCLSGTMFSFAFPQFSPMQLLLLAMEAMIIVPAIMKFAGSSVPAKPQLRRRVMFVLVMNIYLLLLSPFMSGSLHLLFLWQVPGLAMMFSYIISFKFNRLTNIYFILFDIVLLAIMVYGVWLRL